MTEQVRAQRDGRSRWLLVAVVLLLVMALTASAVLAFAWYVDSSIERREVRGLIEPAAAATPDARPGREVTDAEGFTQRILNVLLVGSDDRSVQGSDVVDTGHFEGRRSDTVMLAQIEVGGEGAAILSFPRDLRVELCNGQVDKINAALAVGDATGTGGEACLVETVTSHTGIDIDHYVEVDFGGFVDVVDTLGGVTMYLDQPMQDSRAHLDVPAGCVTLDGEQALGFVRTRGYDDDYGRIQRQQRFLREAIDQVTDVGTLSNPRRIVELVNAAGGSVATDENLSLNDLREMAGGFRELASDGVATFTVPSVTDDIGGISYVIETEAEATQLYGRFQDSSILKQAQGQLDEPAPEEEAPEEEAPEEEAPEEDAPEEDAPAEEEAPAEEVAVEVPPVDVFNATQVPNLAGAVAGRLALGGLSLGRVDNAGGIVLERTEVLHPPGQAEAAQAVAALLPAAEVREDDVVPGVSVYAGADLSVEILEEMPPPEEAGAAVDPEEPTTDVPEADTPGAAEPTPTATPTPAPLATTDPTSRNAEALPNHRC